MAWINVILFVVAMVISYATRPKPQNAKPATLDQFEVPTAEDGRVIGVLFGTRDIKAANVVWYGDLHNKPIKQRGSGQPLLFPILGEVKGDAWPWSDAG